MVNRFSELQMCIRDRNYYAFGIIEYLWKTHENAERTGGFFVTARKATAD